MGEIIIFNRDLVEHFMNEIEKKACELAKKHPDICTVVRCKTDKMIDTVLLCPIENDTVLLSDPLLTASILRGRVHIHSRNLKLQIQIPFSRDCSEVIKPFTFAFENSICHS